MEHYLDNAATTAVCEEAAEAAKYTMLTAYGNPSSTHKKGREAKKILDSSRETLAGALGCKKSEVVFTSCGSESDNWAIICGAESARRNGMHVITSEVEHDAVRKSFDELEKRGFEVTRLAPDSTGKISVDDVISSVRKDTVLISLMLVNNETGAVNDIAAISKAAKGISPNLLVHTDAVQAFMKIPFKAKTIGADLISISGHKIHAPKGIGALYIREGTKLKPFIVGGEQESARRAGTEALPNIAAFAAAVSAYTPMDNLKPYLISRLPDGCTYLDTEAPHILNISLPGYRSEVLMNFLESREIYVSKSSACKQGKRSHVLEACGMDSKSIDGALRIGLSRFTTKTDIDAFIEALTDAKNSLRHL